MNGVIRRIGNEYQFTPPGEPGRRVYTSIMNSTGAGSSTDTAGPSISAPPSSSVDARLRHLEEQFWLIDSRLATIELHNSHMAWIMAAYFEFMGFKPSFPLQP